MVLVIASLHVHPVKSCRGIDVTSARVSRRGLEGDRVFAFLDGAGRVLTQREHPRMAQVEVAFDGKTLTLWTAGRDPVIVDARDPGVDATTASVHGTPIAALRYRDGTASRWMSEHLGTPATLARRDDRAATFTDAQPISVLSRASMNALNASLASPVPINRFRANIVLNGATPFAEDEIAAFDVGGVTFEAVKRISRCVMIQTDQQTGERGIEPMRTLRAMRDVLGRVFFGRYFAPAGDGVVRVGDEVIRVR